MNSLGGAPINPFPSPILKTTPEKVYCSSTKSRDIRLFIALLYNGAIVQLNRDFMPKIHFKISIKSFEHSTLQSAREKVEQLCLSIDSGGILPLHHLQDPVLHVMQPIQSSQAAVDVSKRSKIHSSFPLPSSKKRFTLIRSPHIDKKSREQFQLQTYRVKIETAPYTMEKAWLLLLLLKNTELLGVETKLVISYSTTFCT